MDAPLKKMRVLARQGRELLEASLEQLNSDTYDHYGKVARISLYLGDVYREIGDYKRAKTVAYKPNMGLTAFQGTRVRKGDVVTAKNYLQHEELTELNRIVTKFLDVAEDMARRRKLMYMQDWEKRLDKFCALMSAMRSPMQAK